jgi:hypothetical protein
MVFVGFYHLAPKLADTLLILYRPQLPGYGTRRRGGRRECD